MRFTLRHLSPLYKGALLQVGAKTADHITFNVWNTYTGKSDAPRSVLPWWYGIGPLNIPYDDYVLNLGIPAILAVIGKYKKSAKYKEMAKGAALTGIPLFLNLLLQSPQLLPISMRINNRPLQLNVRPRINNFAPRTQAVSGGGKYTLKTSSNPAMMSGVGKYGKY